MDLSGCVSQCLPVSSDALQRVTELRTIREKRAIQSVVSKPFLSGLYPIDNVKVGTKSISCTTYTKYLCNKIAYIK